MPPHKFTKEIINGICQRYVSGESASRIAKSFSTRHPTIIKYLREMNIPIRSLSDSSRRKLHVNINCFDNITNEAAYWIGFIFADGYISIKPPGNGNNAIKVEISIKDIQHLIKFKNFLNSHHKISIMPGHGYTNSLPTCSIQIRSKTITDMLIYYGCGNKLNNKISEYLSMSCDFWRGMIDADGYVSIGCNIPQIGLCGGRPILEQFVNFVHNLIPKFKGTIRKAKTIFRVDSNSHIARQLITHLYQNAPVYLNRKMKIAQMIINDSPAP